MLTLSKKQISGISLVELLLSMTLGLFLLTGLLQLFVHNKQTFTIREGLSRIQENGRYARYLTTNDLRMAGYQGCRNMSKMTANNQVNPAPANLAFTPSDLLGGFHFTGTSSWSPSLPSWLTNNGAIVVAPLTDVLTLRKASASTVNLTSNMSSASVNIPVTSTITFQPGNLLFISDCQSADIFAATSGTASGTITHNTSGNNSDSLSRAYQLDAQVSRYEFIAYYIKQTGRINARGNPIFALYRQNNNTDTINEEEVIEGVENMHVSYGVDGNNDNAPDTYQTADLITAGNNWAQVVSVKLTLLLNTVEDVSPVLQPYTFDGINYTPTNTNDRLLRKEWSMYINLRDRSL